MEKIIILSNPGSMSKKYSVYENDKEVAWFHVEKTAQGFSCSKKVGTVFEKITLQSDSYQHSLTFVLDSLIKGKIIQEYSDVFSISIRTVIPEEGFAKDLMLTDEVTKHLEKIQSSDPLHIAPVLEEIRDVREHVSGTTRVYLISDSSFHVTSRRKIPVEREVSLHTIGYHGLSCESVLNQLKSNEIEHSRLIVCHLGGGSSVTAIKNGKSVYNSMEYSPLSGVMMATRPGSIDPFVVMKIMKEQNFTHEDMLRFLYTQSGLKAISGVSDDLRDVREEAFKGNADAKNAIMAFVNSIVSHVCTATAYTEGMDTIVFTGTIGFRAAYIREMVTEKLRWLGLHINHDNNTQSIDSCFEISAHDSKIKVYVIQIDEMKEMHRHTMALLEAGV